jgi:hypothetical protein
MDIKKIIKKAYLDGIIEGQVIAKVNMNFDTDGMAEHYAESELKKLRVADVSGRSKQLSRYNSFLNMEYNGFGLDDSDIDNFNNWLNCH